MSEWRDTKNTPQKRYLLFFGNDYYPLGGWEDFYGAFNTIQEAKESNWDLKCLSWGHIVDIETMEIVSQLKRSGKENE